ncbi:hypothetical protein T265_14513, partial [Opisthorchis viverrini]
MLQSDSTNCVIDLTSQETCSGFTRKHTTPMPTSTPELRKRLPTFPYERRLSKIDTLRLAIAYLALLNDMLTNMDCSTNDQSGCGVFSFILNRLRSPTRRFLSWYTSDGSSGRKVRVSNPTSVSRLPLSRLGQPGSIPALMQPSGGTTVRHRMGATAVLHQHFSNLIARLDWVQWDRLGFRGQVDWTSLKTSCNNGLLWTQREAG